VQQSVDISCPPGPQQQTRSSVVRRANEMGKRTDTHSLFHSRLKTFLFRKSFPLQPFLFLLLKYSLHGFPRLFTVISERICFLLLVFLFLHFLVVGSVR